MKVVNMGDPFTRRLTLRLTDLQYTHIIRMAQELDTSPSDYIRLLIMQSAVKYDRDLVIDFAEMGGTSNNENVETSSDNFI